MNGIKRIGVLCVVALNPNTPDPRDKYLINIATAEFNAVIPNHVLALVRMILSISCWSLNVLMLFPCGGILGDKDLGGLTRE